MKLAACLFVSCLIFGSISAGIIPTKHIGDIDNQNKYENKIVQLPVGTDSVEFTFPEVCIKGKSDLVSFGGNVLFYTGGIRSSHRRYWGVLLPTKHTRRISQRRSWTPTSQHPSYQHHSTGRRWHLIPYPLWPIEYKLLSWRFAVNRIQTRINVILHNWIKL